MYGVPEAKTIGFSANLQGGINLALDLALFLKVCCWEVSCVLSFESMAVCMACRSSGVIVSLSPLDSQQVDKPPWCKEVTAVIVLHQITNQRRP